MSSSNSKAFRQFKGFKPKIDTLPLSLASNAAKSEEEKRLRMELAKSIVCKREWPRKMLESGEAEKVLSKRSIEALRKVLWFATKYEREKEEEMWRWKNKPKVEALSPQSTDEEEDDDEDEDDSDSNVQEICANEALNLKKAGPSNDADKGNGLALDKGKGLTLDKGKGLSVIHEEGTGPAVENAAWEEDSPTSCEA